MKVLFNGRTVILFSLPLCLLIIYVSFTAIITPDHYYLETPNWQAQSLGQDNFDLFFAIPALITSMILVWRKIVAGLFIWGGTVIFFLYTFVIYCFDLHFTSLFLFYCLILGLCFYAFLYYLWLGVKYTVQFSPAKSITKIIGIYFIAVAVMFYCLWLIELIPAVSTDTAPETWREAGLVTNPVQVIDLAVFLPALFITGVLLLKRKNIAILLAPALLFFCILMNLCIGLLVLFMKAKGIAADYSVTIIMSILAMISLVLFILYVRSGLKNSIAAN
jgi:hypothetical protein